MSLKGGAWARLRLRSYLAEVIVLVTQVVARADNRVHAALVTRDARVDGRGRIGGGGDPCDPHKSGATRPSTRARQRWWTVHAVHCDDGIALLDPGVPGRPATHPPDAVLMTINGDAVPEAHWRVVLRILRVDTDPKVDLRARLLLPLLLVGRLLALLGHEVARMRPGRARVDAEGHGRGVALGVAHAVEKVLALRHQLTKGLAQLALGRRGRHAHPHLVLTPAERLAAVVIGLAH